MTDDGTIQLTTIPTTVARTMQQTMSLRFVRKYIDAGDQNVEVKTILQQAWLCRENGDVEWRDVELVEE